MPGRLGPHLQDTSQVTVEHLSALPAGHIELLPRTVLLILPIVTVGTATTFQ